MEVGVSSASYFSRMATENAVRDIGAHGVRLAEVFLNTFCEYEPAFIELLAGRLAEAGVTAYSVHPMSTQFEPQLFSIHPRQRADALRLYARVLRAAQRLGARCYVMHGAAVVIAEAAGVHITGADGRTGPIAVPRALRVRMGAEQAPWREVTVLAYCDGYYPYALFHVALYPDRARSGPRVYLFPDDGSMDGTPFVLIEAPEADWARALIEQYRPETG